MHRVYSMFLGLQEFQWAWRKCQRKWLHMGVKQTEYWRWWSFSTVMLKSLGSIWYLRKFPNGKGWKSYFRKITLEQGTEWLGMGGEWGRKSRRPFRSMLWQIKIWCTKLRQWPWMWKSSARFDRYGWTGVAEKEQNRTTSRFLTCMIRQMLMTWTTDEWVKEDEFLFGCTEFWVSYRAS